MNLLFNDCIAGYRLGNTLTENGTVNRGVCIVGNGYLTSIVETLGIDRNSGIPLGTLVSMNMWGITPDIFSHLEEGMVRYLDTMQNPQKDEFYLPIFIDELIHAGKVKCKMLETDAKWFGVTYKEDTPALEAAIRHMTAEGKYNF